jgi:hypothetical protein
MQKLFDKFIRDAVFLFMLFLVDLSRVIHLFIILTVLFIDEGLLQRPDFSKTVSTALNTIPRHHLIAITTILGLVPLKFTINSVLMAHKELNWLDKGHILEVFEHENVLKWFLIVIWQHCHPYALNQS